MIDSIYLAIGHEVTEETRAAMDAWLAEHGQNRHGKHDYHAAQFGLDAAEIREQYRFLSERFEIPPED